MNWNITYLDSEGDDQVISSLNCILHAILIGKDVASSVIEISDSKTDGDGNIIDVAEGNALMTANGGERVYDVECKKGLTLNLTSQTNVAVLWKSANYPGTLA